ncbi:MAG: hypothetical protein H5T85_06465 [Actinobacteria bacterium]|nr:hypothetical protein [Actinomycetota bacterium]
MLCRRSLYIGIGLSLVTLVTTLLFGAFGFKFSSDYFGESIAYFANHNSPSCISNIKNNVSNSLEIASWYQCHSHLEGCEGQGSTINQIFYLTQDTERDITELNSELLNKTTQQKSLREQVGSPRISSSGFQPDTKLIGKKVEKLPPSAKKLPPSVIQKQSFPQTQAQNSQTQVEGESQIQSETQVEEQPQQGAQTQSQDNQQTQTQIVVETANLNGVESQILALINNIRVENGLAPLVPNQMLTDIARTRSQDMQQRNYFSHTTPDGKNIFSILKENGVIYKHAGENLGHASPVSYGSPEAFVNAWMNSPSHRANILRAEYGKIGIGVVDAGNRRVVTTIFMN